MKMKIMKMKIMKVMKKIIYYSKFNDEDNIVVNQVKIKNKKFKKKRRRI